MLSLYYPKHLSTLSYYNEYNNKYIVLNKVKLSDERFADRIHINYSGSYILSNTLINNNLKFIH